MIPLCMAWGGSPSGNDMELRFRAEPLQVLILALAGFLVLLLVALMRYRESRAREDLLVTLALLLGCLWIGLSVGLDRIGMSTGLGLSDQQPSDAVGHLLFGTYLVGLAAATNAMLRGGPTRAAWRFLGGVLGYLALCFAVSLAARARLALFASVPDGLPLQMFHAAVLLLAVSAFVSVATSRIDRTTRLAGIAAWAAVGTPPVAQLVAAGDPNVATLFRFLEAPLVLLHLLALFVFAAFLNHARWRSANERLEKQFAKLIDALTELIQVSERSSPRTIGNTARLAGDIAAQLGLEPSVQRAVQWATLVRDLGKIGVDRSILTSTTRLTPSEWAQVQRHPAIGAEILSKVSGLDDVARIVRHHHEHWDGTGYPEGLRGEQIPVGSRIVALVDTLDAMIRGRSYQPAKTVAETLESIRRLSGVHFDPRIVATFAELLQARGVPFDADAEVPEEP